jgi:hypothetical protein
VVWVPRSVVGGAKQFGLGTLELGERSSTVVTAIMDRFFALIL